MSDSKYFKKKIGHKLLHFDIKAFSQKLKIFENYRNRNRNRKKCICSGKRLVGGKCPSGMCLVGEMSVGEVSGHPYKSQ